MRKQVITRLAAREQPRRRWQRTLTAMLRAALLETRTVEITHQPIRIPKLPEEFNGFRIAQLSDVHHGPFLSEDEIVTAARRVNELNPDLIALTGDYISHSKEYIPGCAGALGNLRARHGVFAVLGNHDHWTDGEMMSNALTDQGIRVLTNENIKINIGESSIRLAGIDDLMVRLDDLPAALAGTSREETRVLLAHNPVIIREAARAGVDLVLSGHTHGGQINWRLLIGREDRRTEKWLKRPSRRLTRGHAQLGSTHLYVNRGLGTVVVPLRYGCLPEITVLELVSG